MSELQTLKSSINPDKKLPSDNSAVIMLIIYNLKMPEFFILKSIPTCELAPCKNFCSLFSIYATAKFLDTANFLDINRRF